jgi:hypothetical protein
MYELQFDETTCLSCPTHDCLTRCQYLEIDRETAKEEILKIARGQDSFVLHDCVTCYACEEYCSFGNHPFYLIAEKSEATRSSACSPTTRNANGEPGRPLSR